MAPPAVFFLSVSLGNDVSLSRTHWHSQDGRHSDRHFATEGLRNGEQLNRTRWRNRHAAGMVLPRATMAQAPMA